MTPDDLIALLDEAGWPVALRAVFDGGVEIVEVRYAEDELEDDADD